MHSQTQADFTSLSMDALSLFQDLTREPRSHLVSLHFMHSENLGRRRTPRWWCPVVAALSSLQHSSPTRLSLVPGETLRQDSTWLSLGSGAQSPGCSPTSCPAPSPRPVHPPLPPGWAWEEGVTDLGFPSINLLGATTFSD